jgi:hypothetical protein
MALDPHPDAVRCANKWRHANTWNGVPAVAFVRDATEHGPGWTPRCRGCVNSLAAANPAAARAHVVYIAADQPVADHDPSDGDRAAADHP